MKNLMIFSIFITGWMLAVVAPAFAFYTPYPPVLSQAIDILPNGFDTIVVGDETFYYSKGVFYKKLVLDDKYTIVSPPIGAVVFSIPEGYQYMLIDGENYYVYQGVYYKRLLDGYKVTYPPVAGGI